jgi:hypothetical protein
MFLCACLVAEPRRTQTPAAAADIWHMMEIYMSERVLLSPAPLAKAVDMELLRVEQRLLAHFCLPREGME